ncbi:MAG: response regulator transcription factor [Hyphomonadaceae bacterium]|nr:response regulator transcription factor [Hyphomonadaceae bacterium]
MNRLSVLVVDDEPLARRRLQLALAELNDVHCAGAAGDGEEALRLIGTLSPDVVLLDVKMPLLDGFDVVRSLGGRGPEFIFVTAYDHFAVRAFDARAIDYLLKPVEFDRLALAIDRARSARSSREARVRVQELTEVMEILRQDARTPTQKRYEREFWLKDRGQWLRVPVDTIDWIEAERDYMRLHCGARSHLMRITMSSLEAALDPTEWLRIHRSVLVRRSRVTALRRTQTGGLMLRASSGVEMPVGRAYMQTVVRQMHPSGRAGDN